MLICPPRCISHCADAVISLANNATVVGDVGTTITQFVTRVMLFTVFHQVQDARSPFLRSNHDIFLISYFLTFYLIFLAHVMKKTLLT